MPEKDKPRRAFKKTFEIQDLDFFMEEGIPLMQDASVLGLVPEPLLIRVRRKYFDLYMDRIRGYDLTHLPRKLDNVRYSTELAVQVADLCQRFYDAEIYHGDFHSGNVMWDQERNRAIAVDGDSLGRGKETPKYVIGDYGHIMNYVYLDYHPGDEAVGEVNNPSAPDFIKEVGKQISSMGFIGEQAQQAIRYYFDREGVTKKVDTRIVDFLIRIWDLNNAPLSFDEILALKST